MVIPPVRLMAERGLDRDPETGAVVAVTPDEQLVVIRPAEGTAVPIPLTMRHPRQPRWLPDGHLLWIDDRGITTHNGEACGDLWRAAPDGTALRRLTRDGFGVVAPVVLADGRIAYLSHRADRGTAVMQIHPDGTGLALLHGGIGDGRRLTGLAAAADGLLLVTDEHGRAWWLDPASGRDPGHSVRPVSGPDAERIRMPVRFGDRMLGWTADPGRAWLVCTPDGRTAPLTDGPDDGWMPVAWIPAHRAHRRPDLVDPRLPHGWLYVNDLRLGRAGSEARAVRILAREWSAGPASAAAMVSLVGVQPIDADGSLFVRVPAEVPLALEALDGQGRRIAGMSGWFTLQRGERASCIGCHVPGDRLPTGHPTAFRRSPATLPTLRHDWIPLGRRTAEAITATCTACHGPDQMPTLLTRTAGALPADHPPVPWTDGDQAVAQAWLDAGQPDHGAWADAIDPTSFQDPAGPWQARQRADAEHLDRVRAWVMGLGGP